MICTLTIHLDITTRDERVFKLVQVLSQVAPIMYVISSSHCSNTSAKTSIFKSSNDAPQLYTWCDKFDYYYSQCQKFQEVIHSDHIYLSKINRILNVQLGQQLSLTIGTSEIKADLYSSV